MVLSDSTQSRALRVLLFVSVLLTPTGTASAERLPIKTYTIEDGLPRNLIRQILQDSHGYLWLVTPSGLSRFDGYEFKNYLAVDFQFLSLSWYMIEDRNGGFWLATYGNGLYRFRPEAASKAGASRFERYQLESTPEAAFANRLVQDRSGKVWCATNAGLFCLDEANGQVEFHQIELGPKTEAKAPVAVVELTDDLEGNLWIGTQMGLFRRLPDGRIIHYRFPVSDPGVGHLFSDHQGKLWIEHSSGLIVLIPESASSVTGDATVRFLSRDKQAKQINGNLRLPSNPDEAVLFTESDGFVGKDISETCQSADGYLWFGIYDRGLLRFDGKRFRLYGKEEGLSHQKVRSLAEDGEGNLWIGTDGGGLMKKVRDGFTGFSPADGIDESLIAFIIEDAEGQICIATDLGGFVRFDGEKFSVLRADSLDKLIHNVVGNGARVSYASPFVKDHSGELWFSTEAGVYRYPRVQRIEQLASVLPKKIYTTKDGLPSNKCYRVFADSRDDIWMSLLGVGEASLCKWERTTNRIRVFGKSDGLATSESIASMCEDKQGNLWFGFGGRSARGGMVARYDGSAFRVFSKEDGVPEGGIRELLVDTKGRLWIASSVGGLGRVDHSEAEHPSFSRYTTADGLADNETNCVAEDQWGNIYVGMGRGLDRIDSATQRVRHYTAADGLKSDDIRKIFADSRKSLWIGTSRGLFHFTPEPESPGTAPPILITKLTIAGEEQSISELGEIFVAGPRLESSRNNMQIEFVSPNVSFATTLKYQYKLEGANTEWSPATQHRSVNYANLSPGRYRFLVRAINSDGVASSQPASITFRILQPIWLRWWFVTIVAGLIGLGIYTAYRYRVARLLELERVRTRIATDLHDDIGASLSRMAVLSEVVKRQTEVDHQESTHMLTDIADSARGLVDSMSDIVWSVDPRKDDLKSVVLRIRQFASDVLEAKAIAWEFKAPGEIENVKLAPEQRRHLFLIFKEAINNVARHSECKSVSLDISLSHHALVAEIRDDGRGFTIESVNELPFNRGGNGLRNLQARASELGGQLKINSSPGEGTQLSLVIPLKVH